MIKGSVQRKLRWVENGVNRSVGASDCGAGHSFVVLFGFHLDFAIFPFPVITAQIIGASSGKIGEAVRAMQRQQYGRCVEAQLILMALRCILRL
jgi:hypothetical protein